jgi:ureidoacrylate peracid hydrolase
MHKVSIPQSVVDRVVARHGREHVHADLVPARTALIVVDMQNAFMLPGVAHAPCLPAQDIVPNINRLAQAVRATGGTVVWIKTAYTDDTLQNWSTLYGMLGPNGTERRAQALTRGSKGYELWPTLEVRPEDLTVEKNRYSAFIQGSSNLADVLRSRGLDTLLITGTVTNVCCESTARDAMMLNFKTIMVTDGNAAVTDEDHNASLIGFYLIFGDIMSTDFAIECLKRNAQKGLAAAE